jgi:RNA polymerase sigma-70 factor, ECF subfamily
MRKRPEMTLVVITALALGLGAYRCLLRPRACQSGLKLFVCLARTGVKAPVMTNPGLLSSYIQLSVFLLQWEKNLEGFAQPVQWRVGAKAETPTEVMADSPRHDQQLLKQLAKGDEASFRILYERYQGRIYRFVLHMSGNGAIAEEVTQEVFMLLIEGQANYEPGKGDVGGYLFGIARNITRRSMQRRHLDVPIGDPDCGGEPLAPESDLDVLDELSRAELIEELRKAVLSLPGIYREAVVLCDLEEMSYADAGRILGCSEGTVASRLHRARTMLKTKLTGQRCDR